MSTNILEGWIRGTCRTYVAVTGNATLNGELSVSLIDGLVPALDDSFTIMTFASGSGSGVLGSLVDDPPACEAVPLPRRRYPPGVQACASAWASVICSGDIFAASASSRCPALGLPCEAERLNHMWPRTSSCGTP